jgi:hypothetical protein
MLIQEKISGADTLLKLYVAIEEDLTARHPQLRARHLPRDPRGGTPGLSAAEVLTILVWGAWRGLRDKAKVYFHVQTYPRQEFPTLGAYTNSSRRRTAIASSCGRPWPWCCIATDKRKAGIRSCGKSPPPLPSATWPARASRARFGTGHGSPRTAWAGGTAVSSTCNVTKRGGSAVLI